MDLYQAIAISGSGMGVQSERLRVVAENIANADTTATTPGGDPYRRKTITFKNVLDLQNGVHKVVVDKIGQDPSSFNLKYDPGHPAAGPDGNVKYPNVNTIIESVDLKEAQRAYEANLNALAISRTMIQQTLAIINK